MRMVTSGFVNDKGRFWTLKVDAPNMRVTTLWGKLGSPRTPRGRKRFFNDRESLWNHVEAITEAKVDAGFVQVS